jgi:ABC-type uncharacterized transport system substrate-binding protein
MVGGNPERLGLVSNLAKPGGNLTGVSNMAIHWAPKALQIIKDALPAHRRLGILFSSAGVRTWTRLGALISYGPVVRIFNGARPATIPIEQATKFDLVLNRKTAQRLGLTLPQTLLAQANLVIE